MAELFVGRAGGSIGLRVGADVHGAEALVRFADRLAGLVRKRLGSRLCRKLDTEDVIQAVYEDFLRLQRERELAFDNWEALWALLALITVRKCARTVEHFTAACRNVTAERSFGMNCGADDAKNRPGVEAISREPEPVHAAIFAEMLAGLLEGLDKRDRQIVTLALDGASTTRICVEIHQSKRTVQRVLQQAWAEFEARIG